MAGRNNEVILGVHMFFYCAGVLVSSLRDLISSFNYGYQCRVPNGTWFFILAKVHRNIAALAGLGFCICPVGTGHW